MQLQPSELEIPSESEHHAIWPGLHGCAEGLEIAQLAKDSSTPIVVVANNSRRLRVLEAELRFFITDHSTVPILHLSDWECLPYDVVSPHPDIISQRLRTLARLHDLKKGVLLLTVAGLLQRVPSPQYILGQSFLLKTGQTIDSENIRSRLQHAGYLSVSQVLSPGEYAVRGGVIDIFPMGSSEPFRLDLFGNQLEKIRLFDPETQKSTRLTDSIELLPGREYPTDNNAINVFRSNFRRQFEGDPQKHLIYREVSKGNIPTGLDFFWPLFFAETTTVFDHISARALWVHDCKHEDAISTHWSSINDRHQLACIVPDRLPVSPEQLYLSPAEFESRSAWTMKIILAPDAQQNSGRTLLPDVFPVEPRSPDAYRALLQHLISSPNRTLITLESLGRLENIAELLRQHGFNPIKVGTWDEFASDRGPRLATIVSDIERGAVLQREKIEIVSEPQIFGERSAHHQRRSSRKRDPESVIRSLAELDIDDPIVHEDHGVGRYRGLTVLGILDNETELMIIEYRDSDKLYVPILNLQLVSRYLGGDPEAAPLHKLGGDSWFKTKERAKKRTRDIAVELLDTQAIRAAQPGQSFNIPQAEYSKFVAQFIHEETTDQVAAINDVLDDLVSDKPMDRLVCGDVGFGKTEIALRASFIAVYNQKQVAILVPTTLLAQQHYYTFQDRFANQPVSIRIMSRFQTPTEIEQTLVGLANGRVDIVIGTHRLIQSDVMFHTLGLVIVDEEHRFGVRQKEYLKNLRKTVDILTLTATPIPRTLNFSMAGVRDISLITTPPDERVAIKTFIRAKHDGLIREACLREINRGGQIYFFAQRS